MASPHKNLTKDKLSKRLIHIQNLKSAKMMLVTAQEYSGHFTQALKDAGSRPTKVAVVLSNFSGVENKINLLQQYADKIIELNNKIVVLERNYTTAVSQNKRYLSSMLDSELFNVQEAINGYASFASNIMSRPQLAEQYALLGSARANLMEKQQAMVEIVTDATVQDVGAAHQGNEYNILTYHNNSLFHGAFLIKVAKANQIVMEGLNTEIFRSTQEIDSPIQK